MNCVIERNQIITSGDVMIQYLKEFYPEKTVCLVGTPDLETNFRENGILLTKEMPDVVVIGFDLTLTYTDVKTGVANGAHGILVLSGETKLEDVAVSDTVPDAIFTGLNEMRQGLKKL